MYVGNAPVGLLLTSLGLTAARVQEAGGDVDLLGIAAIITAISGLVATVGALVIGLRKKDTGNDALVEYLKAQADKMNKGEQP